MREAERDLTELRRIGQIIKDDTVYATPSVRLDLWARAPLSGRGLPLDGLFSEAASIMESAFSFYGGSGAFPASKGRKPRSSDLALPGQIAELMQKSYQANAEECKEQVARLRAQGITPDESAFMPYDHGTLFLGDAFPPEESGNHIQLLGYGIGGWRIGLSFALDTYQRHKDRVLALAEAVHGSGVPETGCFGFAYNTARLTEAHHLHHYQPLTRRFRMISMTESAQIDTQENRPQLYPINSWVYLSKARAALCQIPEDAVRELKGEIHALHENDMGFMIKLTPEPILGDLCHTPDLAPARAAGELFDRCYANRPIYRGIRLGHQADILSWLRRFTVQDG